MYLVPLNLDEPFKKVFECEDIAKAFIQDMLNVEITFIKKLDTDRKITNAAALIRFDYRCKINNQYVIVEMQQGYKQDVIKRFYLYHCLDTALQLETIKETIVKDAKGREHRTRNYSELEPVITIIWMAQDNFDLESDYIEYNIYPKAFADFVRDNTLWESPKSVLEARRADLFRHPKVDRRELSFLEKNRLIFVFQPNVVKNKQFAPYVKWFEFAEKTRNPNNKASDFDEYSNHLIFAQMMNRLSVGHADNQDLIKEMGEEAYRAAKKLGEAVQKAEERQFLYWEIYDEITAPIRKEYDALIQAEQAKRYAAIDQTEAALYETRVIQKILEQERQAAIEQAKSAAAAQKLLEKEKLEAQKLLEKEKLEAQKLLEKEKLEAQKLLEKEKQEAQKLLEKEKQEAQKLLEKEKQERILARKLLQEEHKKAKKLEKEQKKLLEQEQQRSKLLLEKNQIKLMNNLLATGLSVDIIAKSLEVSVQQIADWQKIKK
ncbi:MAG: hypothetical protein RLZZ628_3288 [Bacteroidota bacterium]|jgi:hypothetical protein